MITIGVIIDNPAAWILSKRRTPTHTFPVFTQKEWKLVTLLFFQKNFAHFWYEKSEERCFNNVPRLI